MKQTQLGNSRLHRHTAHCAVCVKREIRETEKQEGVRV
jgi:hypothetical protein